MADETQDFDTVSLDQLDPILLTVDSLLAVANVNGKLFKSRLGDFLTYITPFLSAIGASNFAPVTGAVLPNNTASPSQFTIVGAGTFTQTTGGSITTTSLLNILGWNGTTWALIKAIDTTAFLSKIDYNFAGIYTTTAAANLAVTNVVGTNGKNNRDGKRVDIGANGNYTTYWWKGGFLDSNLTKYVKDVTELVNTSKNLLNYATMVDGFYISNTGVLSANAIYSYSTPIAVTPGLPYHIDSSGGVGARFTCYYDANMVVVAGGSSASIFDFTPPAGVAYVIVSVPTANKTIIQLEQSAVKTTFVPYTPPKNTLASDIHLTAAQVKEQADTLYRAKADKITPTDTTFLIEIPSKNLFNAQTATAGSYVSSAGVVTASGTYSYSTPIAVKDNQDYHIESAGGVGARFICYYDINMTVVPGGPSIPATTFDFKTPVGVKFVVVSILTTQKDTMQLEEGTVKTAYVPFGSSTGFSAGLKVNEISSTLEASIVAKAAGSILVFLPPEICIAVGRTIELYNSQVSWCGNSDNYHYFWNGVGKCMKRKWTMTGVTIGNNTLTLTVYDNNMSLVATATTVVKVVTNVIASPFTVCPIGDSLSNNKPWYNEVITLSGSKISFVGTRGGLKHEGRSGVQSGYYLGNNQYGFDTTGIAGNDGRTQDLNPFWNPGTSAVDFGYYKSNYNQNPNKLMVWLGTNGIALDSASNVANIKAFIDGIRLNAPNIPVFVVLTLFRGDQNGLGNQLGTDGFVSSNAWKLQEDAKVYNLQVALTTALKAYTNLYIVPVSTSHDSEFNFGSVQTTVNPRAAQTEPLAIEATHPQTQGYLQIADIIFSSLAAHQ